MTKLILISGSMAAGKSAVAKELVQPLRARGTQTALAELDEVADMTRGRAVGRLLSDVWHGGPFEEGNYSKNLESL